MENKPLKACKHFVVCPLGTSGGETAAADMNSQV